jgi:hypothetical protein
MAINPANFITGTTGLVDTTLFQSSVSSAVDYARINLAGGVNLAVNAGIAVRSLLPPTPTHLGITALANNYLTTAYSSLATLTAPYDSLAGVTAVSPYAGTLNSLSIAGTIGAGIRDLYASGTIASLGTQIAAGSLAGAAYQIGIADCVISARNIASPYLACASAVHSLEKTYGRVVGSSANGIVSINQYLSTVTPSYVTTLQSSVVSLSGALKATWDTIGASPSFLANAPVSILRSPAVELYTATQTAAAVSLQHGERPEIDTEVEGILEEEVDVIESRLATINQDLVEIYRGGKVAIERGGPDWYRHAMVSFRELNTHVLHLLAPDAEILPAARPEDLHNGQPTRRARLNHIFAGMSGSAFTRFYEADMKAAISLFTLLNDGTHRLGNSATPDQCRYLRGRIVGLISSMLEARGY